MDLTARTTLFVFGMLAMAGCAPSGHEDDAASTAALGETAGARPSSFAELTSAAFDEADTFASGGDDCTFTASSADGALELEISKNDGTSARLLALMTWPVTFEEVIPHVAAFERTFRINSSATFVVAQDYKQDFRVAINDGTSTVSCTQSF